MTSDSWWGTGASTASLEGSSPASDLGDWEARGLAPRSGDGSGFAASHRTDLALLADAGLRHLRLTLDWARLEPRPGERDGAEVERLRQVLGDAREAGVAVWGCLHDGALPGWFSVDEPGFRDARVRGYHWSRHVELVAEAFGDLVHGWVPVFEPNRWAARGWIDGTRPPGARDDAEHFAEALEGALWATVDAALRLRQDGQPVAAAHWAVPAFPARLERDAPPTLDAEAMASVVDRAHWQSWVRLLTEEVVVLGGRPPLAVPGARGAFDVLGLTYRHAVAVRGDGALLPYPQDLPLGPDGRVAWPEGLALALHRQAETLPEHPLLVAGIGLASADERRQEDHLRACLEVVDDAATGGMDVRGLWWDPPFDAAGTGAPRGLWDRDRAPRPAAELLSSVAWGGPVPR
ncbi:MAG: family 1 glycosylhydrolase [Acidimicrobiales bacterium]